MNYVFVFLGEFGYELLNWQGVVRKFAATIGADDRIICCSRAFLYPLYEKADAYIDISDNKEFKASTANGYSYNYYYGSKPLKNSIWKSFLNYNLKRSLKSYILSEMKNKNIDLKGSIKFIFSNEQNCLNDCYFGLYQEFNIYEKLNTANNVYKRIEPDLSVREKIRNNMNLCIDKPFVLCQMRNREIIQRSEDAVDYENIIREICARYPVVLLSFNTGRKLDSYSQFEKYPSCYNYLASTFTEQALLIHFSKICLFFTEKDFGSHIYVPPLMGRNVYAVAPSSVYRLPTTPLDFWNSSVFRFGGQIIPKKSEDFIDKNNIREFVSELSARLS